MNSLRTKRTNLSAIVLLATCAIFLSVTVIAENPKERPFKVKGEGIIDFGTGVSIESGECTHGGHFNNVGQWILIGDGIFYGEGVMAMANGDQLNWYSITYVTSLLIPGEEYTGEGVIIFTGGTGRFLNAIGELEYSLMGILSSDAGTGNIQYVGVGSIAY